jgi:hypothetical protein
VPLFGVREPGRTRRSLRGKLRMWNLNNPYSRRNDVLRRLGFRSYPAYLRSETWAVIRTRVLARDRRRCARCRVKRSTTVHHRIYDEATLTGACIDGLTTLCSRCHAEAEAPWRPRAAYDRQQEANAYIQQKPEPAPQRIGKQQAARLKRYPPAQTRLAVAAFYQRRDKLHEEQAAILDRVLAEIERDKRDEYAVKMGE